MASTKSFLSILAGLAAGAAIGILYAPDKGWKTRARVKKAAANGYEDLKENLGDLGTKVDEKTAEAKETINNLRDTLREKGSEIKEGTRKLLVEQLERLEKALKQAEEAAEEAAGSVPDEQDPQA
ncbi:MAG: YtxH domain-containing protein [Bacteroidales bacterium]|jgi:gas vesicle protein|nr:YtxH domain-containing protein [Bacteroidales bacterium]MBR2228488.1 YtxH domain-containing protein [Bacteroidales bacterium]MBR2747573.1 YtxH domain-containing protein [Bacteroidales bacterium]